MLDPTHTTLLQQIHADWVAHGWDLDDLRSFRMEADGDGDGGSGDKDGSGDGSSDDTGDGDADLGEKGEKALRAERDAKRAAEKAAKAEKKRADTLAAELEALKNPSGDDAAKAAAAAKKAVDDAREEAKAEASAEANRRILKAEVKAAAGGVLADPNDAVRLLDLDDFDVDDDGDVDEGEIKKVIKQLVKDKPYLAIGFKPKPGSADGGARNTATDDDSVTPGSGRLRNAYATSSKQK